MDGNTAGGENRISLEDSLERSRDLDALIDLLGQFSRTKLSLQSLLLRPKWRDELIGQLKLADLDLEDPEMYFQWMPTFYRLSRRLHEESCGLNMRAVAETIGVPLSTATRLTDNFVSRGLLERHPDTSDRRIVLVSLTAKGQTTHQIADANIRQRLEDLLGQFTHEERSQLFILGSRLFHFWTASLEAMSNSHKEAHTP